MGYAAIYPEDVIAHHRAFIARRRSQRPRRGVPRPHSRGVGPVPAPLRAAQGRSRRMHPRLRHPCAHEHSCIRSTPTARPRPAAASGRNPRQPPRPVSPRPNARAGSVRSLGSKPPSPPPSRSCTRWTNSALDTAPPSSACPTSEVQPAAKHDPPGHLVARDQRQIRMPRGGGASIRVPSNGARFVGRVTGRWALIGRLQPELSTSRRR